MNTQDIDNILSKLPVNARMAITTLNNTGKAAVKECNLEKLTEYTNKFMGYIYALIHCDIITAKDGKDLRDLYMYG